MIEKWLTKAAISVATPDSSDKILTCGWFSTGTSQEPRIKGYFP